MAKAPGAADREPAVSGRPGMTIFDPGSRFVSILGTLSGGRVAGFIIFGATDSAFAFSRSVSSSTFGLPDGTGGGLATAADRIASTNSAIDAYRASGAAAISPAKHRRRSSGTSGRNSISSPALGFASGNLPVSIANITPPNASRSRSAPAASEGIHAGSELKSPESESSASDTPACAFCASRPATPKLTTRTVP